MAELKKGYKHNPNAEWVGEVPDSWEFYKGKYVFGERFEKGNEKNLELLSPTQKYGVIPQSMYDELSGMRAVKVKESTDLSLFKTVHVGDFCISLRSFQGGFEYSKYEGVVSPAYHILFPKKIIEDGYYKYLFKEQSFIAEMNSYCQSLRDGKNISYTDFGKTLIPYPPLAEQRAIASYLDDRCSKLDEIIAEAEKSIEEYKELKQAVIFEAVTKGLDKNAPMRESGIEWIREIPSTWNVIRIKYLLDEINKDLAELGESGGDIMKIDWKRKLSSRKFWLSIANFVTLIIIAMGYTDTQAAQVSAIIMAGASVVAYIIAEGLTDSANTASNQEVNNNSNKE